MPCAGARGYHNPMDSSRRTMLAALLGCLAGAVLVTAAFWLGRDGRKPGEIIGLFRRGLAGRCRKGLYF